MRKPQRRKWSKEFLEPLVKESLSVYEVLRRAGMRATAGTSFLVGQRIKEYELDTSHFLGRAVDHGPGRRGGFKKKHWKEILVLRKPPQFKDDVGRVRRAMIESGILHECALCSMGPEWRGEKLVLQVDHRNGNRIDNRKRNVRFLCPNCHSQTENWCNRRRARVAAPVREAGARKGVPVRLRPRASPR